MGLKYEDRRFFHQSDKHYLFGNVASLVQSGKNSTERAEILIFFWFG
jgi:hypothetical protein